MSLIYSVIAHGSIILAEHTNSTGNYGTGNESMGVLFDFLHSIDALIAFTL